jgi:hypothetical protein
MQRRALLLFGVALWFGDCSTRSAAFQAGPGGLSAEEIRAAISLGEQREPPPYLLRHAGRPDNPQVVAAVYTPFLRVALLSHAAHARGERLEPRSIEPRVLEPLVYIAFRWYCCADASTEALAAAEPRVLMLPIAPRAPQFVNFMNRRGATQPVWSRTGTAVLESFGARPPYDDIVLVAAFPSGVLQAGRPFVIYKDAGEAQAVITGVVRGDDALAWR